MLGWFGFGWLNQRGRRALLEVLLLDVGCVVVESQVSVLNFWSPQVDVNFPFKGISQREVLGYDP
jgi:hypothetical protein